MLGFPKVAQDTPYTIKKKLYLIAISPPRFSAYFLCASTFFVTFTFFYVICWIIINFGISNIGISFYTFI